MTFRLNLGRNYTVSFKIKSTLKGTVTNEETKEEKTIDSKHILFKAYDQKSKGEPSVNFTSVSGATSGGYITVKNGDDYKTVTATVRFLTQERHMAEMLWDLSLL